MPCEEVGRRTFARDLIESSERLIGPFFSSCRIGLEDGRPDMQIPEYSGGLGSLARAVFERVAEIQEGKVPGHKWIVEI